MDDGVVLALVAEAVEELFWKALWNITKSDILRRSRLSLSRM